MEPLLKFQVLTKPLHQPRPRFARRGSFVKAYTPSKVMGRSLPKYLAAIRQAAIDAGAVMTSDPLAFELEVVIAPPKTLCRANGEMKPSSRPFPTARKDGDVDNYSKNVIDQCIGVLFEDDSQVVDLHVTKRWGCESTEGIYVTVRKKGLAGPGA